MPRLKRIAKALRASTLTEPSQPGITLIKKASREVDPLSTELIAKMLAEEAGSSRLHQGEREPEESEDNATYHLAWLYDKIQRDEQANQQQATQIAISNANVSLLEEMLQKKNEDVGLLQEEVAIKASLVDAEQERAQDFSQRLNLMTQRATKAEHELQIKDMEANQMRIALKAANERRAQSENMLNQLLEDPVLATPAALSADEALRKENETLAGQVKAKELQVDLLTQMFLTKEQELAAKVKELQIQLE